MKLHDVWEKYQVNKLLNYADVAKFLTKEGQTVTYPPGKMIVQRGDFPEYIYFIIEGLAIGQREYEDGSEYRYFQVDKQNGNLGLLEILSKNEQYVATITSLTEVVAVKVESAAVYDILMNDLDLLRKCSLLLADDLYQRSGNDGIYYYYEGIDRLRLFLLNYAEQLQMKYLSQDSLLVEMSYEQIAAQIGVSIRTVGRSVHKLKKNGEISISGKKIKISEDQYQKLKNYWAG
ncbi:Crp/Fnr family transcriptional regulator [Vagococcus acidifermentans]|nr:Crp/Fnr family transcriptional regulator [Vagococcus acidifermentans]